jgi:hypothetical protein
VISHQHWDLLRLRSKAHPAAQGPQGPQGPQGRAARPGRRGRCRPLSGSTGNAPAWAPRGFKWAQRHGGFSLRENVRKYGKYEKILLKTSKNGNLRRNTWRLNGEEVNWIGAKKIGFHQSIRIFDQQIV